MVLGLDHLVQLDEPWMFQAVEDLYLSFNDSSSGFTVHLSLLISFDGALSSTDSVDSLMDCGIAPLAKSIAHLVVQQAATCFVLLLRPVLSSFSGFQVVLDTDTVLFWWERLIRLSFVATREEIWEVRVTGRRGMWLGRSWL